MRDLFLQGCRRLPHRLDLRKNIRQVLFQHPAAIGHRRVPGATQFCERLHLADGHMRGAQTQQEFDPDHVGRRITPLPPGRARYRGNQPDALVIAQGVGRQARALGDFVNAQMGFHDVDSGSWSALQVKRFVVGVRAVQRRAS